MKRTSYVNLYQNYILVTTGKGKETLLPNKSSLKLKLCNANPSSAVSGSLLIALFLIGNLVFNIFCLAKLKGKSLDPFFLEYKINYKACICWVKLNFKLAKEINLSHMATVAIPTKLRRVAYRGNEAGTSYFPPAQPHKIKSKMAKRTTLHT